MYQDLSKRHDWPVKKAMVHLPISLKGNSERISGNSLSPFGGVGGGGGWGLGGQNKDLGSAFPPIRDVTNRGHMTSATRLTTVRVATNLQESGLGEIKETVDLDV